jgi:hypothetical protein
MRGRVTASRLGSSRSSSSIWLLQHQDPRLPPGPPDEVLPLPQPPLVTHLRRPTQLILNPRTPPPPPLPSIGFYCALASPFLSLPKSLLYWHTPAFSCSSASPPPRWNPWSKRPVRYVKSVEAGPAKNTPPLPALLPRHSHHGSSTVIVLAHTPRSFSHYFPCLPPSFYGPALSLTSSSQQNTRPAGP